MSLIGWSKKFEQYQALTDVPERVRKTEAVYWCSLIAAVLIMVAGIIMMFSSNSLFGLFLAIVGTIDIALVKIWAHIRLATYQIIMELQARDKR
jgi:cytochrome b subunit of formate dehydrogenase